MADTATEEKPITFASENERAKAIMDMPNDPPPNVNVDKWLEEQESLFKKYEEAEIVTGEEKDDLPDPDAPAGEPIPESKEVKDQNPPQDPPQDPPVANPLEAQLNELKTQMATMQHNHESSMNAKLEAQKEEYEAKIKELNAGSEPEPTQQTLANQDRIEEIESKLSEMGTQVNSLIEEVEGVTDFYDNEENIKKVVKSQKIQTQMTALQNELSQLYKKNHEQTMKQLGEVSTKAEKEAQARKEEAEKEKQQKEAEAANEKFVNGLEEFRSGHDELKGRNYQEMENDYLQFRDKVAEVYYGKPVSQLTGAQREVAVFRYLDKTPQLVEQVTANGIQEPKDMDQYLKLSDISFALDGQQINKITGNIENITNVRGQKVNMASFDQAYNYIKEKNGITGQEKLDNEQKAVENYSQASQQRADVTELGSEHQVQDVNEMTSEEAFKIVNAADDVELVMKKRRNPQDPAVLTYEKASKVLDPGYDGIPI